MLFRSDTNYIQAYTIGGTASAIVAALPTTAPVTAIASGGGAGSITQSTWAELSANSWYTLVDGINYVKATTPAAFPLNYTIDLKNTVTNPGDTTWTTEEVYLVPMTAANIASYLNVLAVTGISANGEIVASSRAGKVQIATDKAGTVGSIDIRGGTANSAVASIKGTAGLTGDSLSMYVAANTAELNGFRPGWWATLTNDVGSYKASTVPTVNLTSIVGNTFTFGAAVTSPAAFGYNAAVPLQIEKQGQYVAYVWDGTGSTPTNYNLYAAGDYVQITGGTASVNNTGLFLIIAIDTTNKIFWVENSSGVEERATGNVQMFTKGSVLPGDKIIVGTSAWGVDNQRTFTVATIDTTGGVFFTTVETPAASGAVAGPQPLIKVQAGSPAKYIKKVSHVTPITGSTTLSAVILEGTPGNDVISEVFGAQISMVGKLDFPAGVSTGTDGYAHSIGLIGESNRVLYGDESDPVTYPGVVAAGANVNLSGPVVRRIEVALVLRIRQGASKNTVFDAVRSAVTSFINGLGVGENIAISDIVSVAAAIGGVESVSVSSPTYTSSSDLISVQPFEKPLVLQPELDISLSLAG